MVRPHLYSAVGGVYLKCTRRMREAAMLAVTRPVVQQRLRQDSSWDGSCGRKYTSCTSRCWDSEGNSTRLPS